MLARADTPKSRLFKILECTSDVGHAGDGQVHDSAGGGLVGGNRHLGRALVGDDHARGTNNLRGAHDGAKVAGVGHMVEHHHERGPFAGACNDIGKLGVREGANFKHDALVRAVRGDGIELGAGTGNDGHAGRV